MSEALVEGVLRPDEIRDLMTGNIPDAGSFFDGRVVENGRPDYGIAVDDSRDGLLTVFGKDSLKNRYLLDGESYQDLFARAARINSSNDAHANRMYNNISRHWVMPATPALSNSGRKRGLPISCFLNEADDSLKGIIDTWTENSYLGASGGGSGSYWGNLRSLGEKVGADGKSCGAIPFLKVMDSISMAISQGGLRRFSSAGYLPVNHPDIEEFIDVRKPTGGDPNRRCLNSHHGVVVDDAFMKAVKEDAEYELISPHTGAVMGKLSARNVWIRILTMRLEQGEPYILFIDTVNRLMPWWQKKLGLKVKTSNLCVHGDTRILTKTGYRFIKELAGTTVTIWNGHEWSDARVEQTAENARMRLIEFSNGAKMYVTDYHKFYTQNSYGANPKEVRAADLVPGDKIEKWNAPVIGEERNDENVGLAYASGLMSADGCHTAKNKSVIWLYGEKVNLAPYLKECGFHISNPDSNGRVGAWIKTNLIRRKYDVPHEESLSYRLAWLAGYLDGDGCVARNGTSESFQMSSTDDEFLNEIRLMLNTMGVDCNVSPMREEGIYMLPDSNKNPAPYHCKKTFRSCISSGDTQRLLALGLPIKRLSIERREIQRDSRQFVTVVSNGTDFVEGPTYCANEPKRHRLILEGMSTGNCVEITLPTGFDHLNNIRTAVCCLSSLNLNYWDEWKDDDQFFEDVFLFLDNVLNEFIRKAPPELHRAVYSAQRERSVGLGVMGWHDFLQERGIPFESMKAVAWNHKVFRPLRMQADRVSRLLAERLGPCPDAQDAGVMERFACKLAIAPTASISVIAGNASPGIETIPANAYNQKTQFGSFMVKNQRLERLLKSIGHNDNDVWDSIKSHLGSVQHLDFLTDDQKKLYRTSHEMDQIWAVRHAAARAPYICQSQSLNLYLPANVSKQKLHEIHYEGWRAGVKSFYYCRSLSLNRADNISDAIEVNPILPPGVEADVQTPMTGEMNGSGVEVCESCQ